MNLPCTAKTISIYTSHFRGYNQIRPSNVQNEVLIQRTTDWTSVIRCTQLTSLSYEFVESTFQILTCNSRCSCSCSCSCHRISFILLEVNYSLTQKLQLNSDISPWYCDCPGPSPWFYVFTNSELAAEILRYIIFQSLLFRIFINVQQFGFPWCEDYMFNQRWIKVKFSLQLRTGGFYPFSATLVATLSWLSLSCSSIAGRISLYKQSSWELASSLISYNSVSQGNLDDNFSRRLCFHRKRQNQCIWAAMTSIFFLRQNSVW